FAPPCLFAAYMGGFWLLAMIIILMSLAIWEWWKLCRHLKTDAEHTIFLGGLLYMGLSAYAFYTLGKPEWDHAAFAILVIVIGSDVGAYFAGTKFGGPKMFPSISPNKTWAGLGGAMAGGAFIAFLCWLLGIHIHHIGFVPVAGIVVGLAGQAGDLLESWAKRLAGIKDTGGFLPGHGGILDRIDSLVMAVPVFMILSGFS
ncbi:MAG TPA: phosphatidate cytidylyltransferase, partial [Alphaproteobacteria bacterium]|nr:phosphatidate cytidylyltransferase [Alphaproteobacteria bacterium]